MSYKKYKITVLLPTRGRTTALQRSVMSLVNKCADKKRIQLILGFDNDDQTGLDYFVNTIQPWLDEVEVEYTAMSFEPLTYAGLNLYYNNMAEDVHTDWFFVWNDDAIMDTDGWDQVINQYDGEFKLLKVHTHGEHPYSIFPIVPAEWFAALGYFSQHQMIDAELSEVAYILDIMQIVDIYVTHDRADLTGNNKDLTDAVRVRFEGNPANPRDFLNRVLVSQRWTDASKLYTILKAKGHDMNWYEAVMEGTQDPWTKLRANDINKQMHTVMIQ